MICQQYIASLDVNARSLFELYRGKAVFVVLIPVFGEQFRGQEPQNIFHE